MISPTWATVAQVYAVLGVHKDTICSALQDAQSRNEAWVKKERPAYHQRGRPIWWIDIASPEYQFLAERWIRLGVAKGTRLTGPQSVSPWPNVLPAGRNQAEARLRLLPVGSVLWSDHTLQLLGAYLAAQGLNVFVNALDVCGESPWKWRWGERHGEGYPTAEKAIAAALESSICKSQEAKPVWLSQDRSR